MGYLYLFNREIVVRYFVSRAAAAGVGDCLGCFAGCVSVYDAVFVDKLCRRQFVHRLSDLLSLPVTQLGSVYTRGPADINVDLTDNVRVEPLIIYYIYVHKVDAQRVDIQWRAWPHATVAQAWRVTPCPASLCSSSSSVRRQPTARRDDITHSQITVSAQGRV